MGKKKTTVINQPKPVDPSESMGEYLFGKGFKNFAGITDPRLQQRILEAEARFRPQYTALELAEQEAALFGRDGQAGLIELQRRAGEEAIDFEEAARERQIRQETSLLGELGADVTEALREADPYSTELAEQTRRRALGQLTFDEERDIQQAARKSAAARGRTGAVADFGEVLGRRQFTDQYTQPAFQMSRAIGGDPSQFLFGRPTQQTQMGTQLYGQAFGLAGQQQGPQLFDPNVGVNLALQQRSQDMTLMGAQAQAKATKSAGRSGMFGDIASAALPLIFKCWVAREVYGINNPKWLMFREWLDTKAPSWFDKLYIKHGERFAKFISNKPFIKNLIRKWMDTKIK